MSVSSETSGLVGWVVGLMETLGAPGVGLAIALENIFPPLPSEVFLPLAGFAAARGDLSVPSAIFWTTLGSLVGALALYGLGAGLGRDRLRAIADRMPLVDVGDIDKAETWFARHGAKAVFFGRMIPLVRSMISVPAGVERMSLPLFAALTTAGSLIWNSAFVLAGYGLGENWHVVEQYAGIASRIVLVVVVLALGWFVVRKVRAHRAGAGRATGEDPTVPLPAVSPAVAPDAASTAVVSPAVVSPAVELNAAARTVRLHAPPSPPAPPPARRGRTARPRSAPRPARPDGRHPSPERPPRPAPAPRPGPRPPPHLTAAPTARASSARHRRRGAGADATMPVRCRGPAPYLGSWTRRSTSGSERSCRSRCHWRWAATRPLVSRRVAGSAASAQAQSPCSRASSSR